MWFWDFRKNDKNGTLVVALYSTIFSLATFFLKYYYKLINLKIQISTNYYTQLSCLASPPTQLRMIIPQKSRIRVKKWFRLFEDLAIF